MLAHIVAIDDKGLIGYDNDIPWEVPEDLKHFRDTTFGHTVIMGKNTFESLNYRALPGRVNIVVSSTLPQEEHPSVSIVPTVEEALAIPREEDTVFIMGGQKLYESTFHLISRIYLTVLNIDIEAQIRPLESYDPNLVVKYDIEAAIGNWGTIKKEPIKWLIEDEVYTTIFHKEPPGQSNPTLKGEACF